MNIANPAAPTVLGRYEALQSPRRLRVIGTLAYITSDAGLSILDITDPSHPLLRGNRSIQAANNLAVSGKLVIVAGSAGLSIVDVSDPTRPLIRSTFSQSGSQYAVLEAAGNLV